jgi:PST family polysaccharide transporter
MSNQDPTNSRLQTDTLVSSVLLLMIATVLQRSIGFVRSVLFCRWLTPETLGQWEMAYSFLLLAAPLAVLVIAAFGTNLILTSRERAQLRALLFQYLAKFKPSLRQKAGSATGA